MLHNFLRISCSKCGVFTVADPRKQLIGQVAVEFGTLDRGQLQTCTDTIENTGTSDLLENPIRKLLVNYESGQIISSDDTTVNLSAGTQSILPRTVPTNRLEAGGYACILQALVENEWLTLAHARFTLTLPPIILDSQLVRGNTGRLLILLDNDPAACANTNSTNCAKGNNTIGNSVTDPHGSFSAPDLMEQRTYLEQLLTDNHWTYTITTTAQAFTQAFRSGTYTVYALLSEQEKLSEQVQQELREAVFRGNGLLVAGSHDLRHNQLDTPLGVKILGKHSQVSGVELYSDHFPVNNIADWSFAETAEQVGYYSDTNQEVSVARNGYGLGRTFFVGFDLIAQASQVDAAPLFQSIILEGLLDIEPKQPDHYSGAPASVHLNLINQGIATPGQVFITIPANTTVLDAGMAQRENSNHLLWPFD